MGRPRNNKTIYIAGPMSGYEDFNFPAFMAAEDRLREQGWKVLNPANKAQEADLRPDSLMDGDTHLAIEQGFDFRAAYKWDVNAVIDSDAVYMLKGWEDSTGARGEHAVATAMKRQFPSYEIIYE